MLTAESQPEQRWSIWFGMRSQISIVYSVLAVSVFASCLPGDVAAQPVAALAEVPASRISLESALLQGDDGNIDAIRVRLGVDTAQANLKSADAAPNPALNISAVQVRPWRFGSVPGDQLADTVVGIDLPLERGGKRRARTAAARALIAAAQNDYASARRDMREAVFDAYFDLKGAEERLEILRSISATYVDSFGLALKQEQAGGLSQNDVARQAVEASRARTDLQQAVTDWRAAQLTLASLIGREVDAGSIATSSDWPQTPAPRPEAADLLALQRPDVIAAQARVEAANRNLDGAHALRHPDVTVSAQYEHAPGSLGVGSSVGLGLSVPLPVRNTYNGEVDAAGTAVTLAEAEARKAAASATAEIAIARSAFAQTLQRQREIEEQQVPAARKAASIAEFSYAHGASSLLDLLDARRSLRAVELGAIDARTDLAHAIAQLRTAETTGDE